MEVVEKEATESVVKEKGTKAIVLKPNIGELFELQKACSRLLQTSNAMKGKYIRILHQNANTMHPILLEASERQLVIMKSHIVLDEKGEMTRVVEEVKEGEQQNPNAPFAYKSEDDEQMCQAELNALWISVPDLKLYKLTKEEFDSLIINPIANKEIGLIIEFLVH